MSGPARRPGGATRLALAGAVAWSGASVGRAVEDVPVFGRREKLPILQFDKPNWRLELTGQYSRQETRTAGQPEEATELLFRESLTGSTRGAIIHPNLIDLSLSGAFGLSQDRFESNQTGRQSADTMIYGFDCSATFLRKEVAPLTLYATRRETTENRDFGPSLRNLTTTYGGTWEIRWPTAPTRFQAYHNEQESIDPAGEAGFRQEQDAALWHTDFKPSSNQVVNWDYSYNNVRGRPDIGPTVTIETHEATLSHLLLFGSGNEHSLTSTVNYLEQTGEFALTRMRWTEDLYMLHSDTFDTFAHYELTREDSDTFDQTHHRGEMGFHHRLFKSLVTTGRGGVDLQETTGGSQITDWFGDLNLNYTKKVPYGTLGANFGAHYDRREADPQTRPVQVIDQSGTFSDPSPILLPFNTVPSSIRITNASGLRVYQEGIDYAVLALPTRVEIRRLLGGAIDPGQSVLIDYQLGAQPGSTTTTASFNVGGRYSIEEGVLKGLSVYASYVWQDQQIDTSVPAAFIPDNVRDLTLGVDYRFWNMVVGAEYQHRQSELSPYDSWRYRAQYSQRILDQTVLSATADYQTIDYTDENNQVRFFQVSSTLSQDLGQNLRIVATVSYRDEENDLFGASRGFEQQIELNWRYRQTTVFARARNVSLETSGDERNFQYFQIGLQRDF
jgi:hypothetical protein